MATGFGIPNDAAGNGTTPEDIQIITAAEYPEAGIISGCEVAGTSTMAWKISSGAVVVNLAEGRAVRVPVQAQTVNTQPAPATGSREEYIYVKQNTTAVDGNINATVGIGASVPANAVMLSKRNITASTRSTSAAPEVGNPVYARPVGGSYGVLHHNYYTESEARTDGVFTRGAGQFYVPTDRNINILLSSTVATIGAGPNGERGSIVYKVYIDDKFQFRRERTIDNIANTEDTQRILTVKAGLHRIHYTVQRKMSSNKWQVFGGGEWGFAGDQIAVIDVGVAKE